jgi:hypothetical protein
MNWFDLYAMFAPLLCFVMGTVFGVSIVHVAARSNSRRPSYLRR